MEGSQWVKIPTAWGKAEDIFGLICHPSVDLFTLRALELPPTTSMQLIPSTLLNICL